MPADPLLGLSAGLSCATYVSVDPRLHPSTPPALVHAGWSTCHTLPSSFCDISIFSKFAFQCWSPQRYVGVCCELPVKAFPRALHNFTRLQYFCFVFCWLLPLLLLLIVIDFFFLVSVSWIFGVFSLSLHPAGGHLSGELFPSSVALCAYTAANPMLERMLCRVSRVGLGLGSDGDGGDGACSGTNARHGAAGTSRQWGEMRCVELLLRIIVR